MNKRDRLTLTQYRVDAGPFKTQTHAKEAITEARRLCVLDHNDSTDKREYRGEGWFVLCQTGAGTRWLTVED